MATFNPRAFFRSVGPERADRYFARCGLSAHSGQQRSTERHWRSFLELGAAQQSQHLQVWQRVDRLSHPLARAVLQLAYRLQWGAGSNRVLRAAASTTAQLAFDLYLEAPESFRQAELWFSQTPLTRAFAFTARAALREVPLLSSMKRSAFQAHLAPQLALTAGQGRVVIEDHADHESLTLFLYFESAPLLIEAISAEGVAANEVRPTVCAALRFLPAQRLLTVHLPEGPRALACAMRDSFAEVYLGERGFFVDSAQGQFDFGPLARNGWQPGPCEYPVRSVAVTEVAFRLPVAQGGVLTVQAASDLGPMIDALLKEPLDANAVLAVRLRFRVIRDGVEHDRVVMLRLPDECHLLSDASSPYLEEHLIRWGLWRVSDQVAEELASSEAEKRDDALVA